MTQREIQGGEVLGQDHPPVDVETSNQADGPRPIPGANQAARPPSRLGRFTLPIAGAVLIVVGALLLFLPVFRLSGLQMSIMRGRDVCSAFGSTSGDCSTINLVFFASLFLVVAGLVLVAVGLVRYGGSSTEGTGSHAVGPGIGSFATGSQSAASALRSVAAPITWPTTSTGWMIGGGVASGVLSLLLPWSDGYGYFANWGLARPLNVLLMLGLVGVAATVFLPDRLPKFAYQRLAVLVVTLVGLGVGFDQLGGSPAFGALLFLLGMLSAASGAAILELPATTAAPVTPDPIA